MDRPSKSINHSDHGIQRVEKKAPFPKRLAELVREFVMNHPAAVGDRTCIQPELNDERNENAKVAIADGEGGDNQTRSQRRRNGEYDEGGQSEQSPGGPEVIPDHQSDQDGARNQKVHERNDNGAGGNNHAREIDLGNQIGIADHALAGQGKRIGKKLPGKRGGAYHNGVGGAAFGRQPRDFPKNNSHDDYAHQGLDERPGRARSGLLVAHDHVAPREDQEQLAVIKQVTPVILHGAARLKN